MARMITAKLGRSTYVVRFDGSDPTTLGLTRLPDDGPLDVGEIVINSDLRGVVLLDTLIHEGLHAIAPYLDEDTVREAATQLANLLVQAAQLYEPSD